MIELGEIRIFLLFPFLHPIFCYTKYKFGDIIFKDLNNLYLFKILLNLIFIHFTLLSKLFLKLYQKLEEKEKI